MYKYGIKYEKNWEHCINLIVKNISNTKIELNKVLYNIFKKIREQYYILFITNVPTQLIIRQIMSKLIKITNNLMLRYNIINITSIFEQRLSQGTRHIIHIEAYIARLILLFNNYNNQNNNNLDVFEI